jgi:hypothetical protein
MEVRRKVGRRSIVASVSAMALLLGVVLITPSFAAPTAGNPGDGTFELEGNAVNNTSVAGEDWSDVYANTSTADAASFVAEPSRAATIFTGGGSKDINDISAWRHKDGAGGLPDKDNLRDAFAARYGDLIVFGSDRFDNSGDAQQGFWFFQNAVSTNTDGTFSGVHKDGDLLILSDFSIGGTVSSIAVYEWVASGGNVSTHLNSLFSSESANCLPTTHTGDICGVVNPTNGTATGGWNFTDKSGNSTYLQGEFYEGGINLAAFSQFSGECFASFAAETRSSRSPTATLKDFILGNFEACESSLTSEQTWVPNDSATVSGGGASSYTGDLKFTLYDTLTCTGNVLYTQTFSNVSGTSSTDITRSTTNSGVDDPATSAIEGYTASATGEFSWLVEFTSKTTGVGSSSGCEKSSLTVTN